VTSTISHCAGNAYKAMSLSIAIGHGAIFDIYDIATEAQWVELVTGGHAAEVIVHALAGAAGSLRRFGATAADVLSCPTASPGGLVTEEDMHVAIGWLATALYEEISRARAHARVFRDLQERSWCADPAHITSLVLAVAVAAGHARDHNRG
jgi:hypothetical protein